MPDLYDYLLRIVALVKAVGDANLAWFPPKLGVFVNRFVPIDTTMLCPNGRNSIECHRLVNFVFKNIDDVIKLVYNRWVVYDYAIFIASFAWSLMNNNLNSQCLTLIATFVAGHIVQTGVHAFAVQKVTRCRNNDPVCGWSVDELMHFHGMITFAFLSIYVFCLKSNTNTQKMGKRIQCMQSELYDEINKLKGELVVTNDELAQTRYGLEQTINELIHVKAQSKMLNTRSLLKQQR